MDEEEWLTCSDPEAMLEFLAARISARRLRLFAVASVRKMLFIARDERSRKAIEVAERWADGKATAQERADAEYDAMEVVTEFRPGGIGWFAAMAAKTTVAEKLSPQAVATQTRPSSPMRQYQHEMDKKHQADLIRDIAGNPFRPVVLKAEWLTGSGGTIPRLARAIYDDRAFDRLPQLADSLQDAGCTDADLLSHLRGPGPHALGCWAVDLILGKE